MCWEQKNWILISQVHAPNISTRRANDGSSLGLDTWSSSANQKPKVSWPWPIRGPLLTRLSLWRRTRDKAPGVRPLLSVSVVRIMTLTIFFWEYFLSRAPWMFACFLFWLTALSGRSGSLSWSDQSQSLEHLPTAGVRKPAKLDFWAVNCSEKY